MIPSSSQSAPTLVLRLPMLAMASRSFAAVIFGLRPPTRPRARAEARPARVRSVMSSRSNSARAAKMPKTSLPAAVVVSIAAPWLEARRPSVASPVSNGASSLGADDRSQRS